MFNLPENRTCCMPMSPCSVDRFRRRSAQCHGCCGSRNVLKPKPLPHNRFQSSHTVSSKEYQVTLDTSRHLENERSQKALGTSLRYFRVAVDQIQPETLPSFFFSFQTRFSYSLIFIIGNLLRPSLASEFIEQKNLSAVKT